MEEQTGGILSTTEQENVQENPEEVHARFMQRVRIATVAISFTSAGLLTFNSMLGIGMHHEQISSVFDGVKSVLQTAGAGVDMATLTELAKVGLNNNGIVSAVGLAVAAALMYTSGTLFAYEAARR